MDWFLTLLSDKSSFAHALLAYSLIIAAGLWIGRFKIFGVGIGITCVLFLGLVASFLGVKIDPAIISFFRNFGLVLFVFFIGLQVGPSFFSTLRSSGWGLNGLMCLSVLTSILITIGMYFAADGALPLPQLLGVHFGMGLVGLWIGMAADECFRGILFVFRFRAGRWQRYAQAPHAAAQVQ